MAAPEPPSQACAWVEHEPALDAHRLTAVVRADPGATRERPHPAHRRDPRAGD